MSSPKQLSHRNTSLSRQWTSKASALLSYLQKRSEAVEFLKPVDYKALGLDDYPLIIKQPMDLSTIKRKLKISKYSSITEVVADLSLVWYNCRTYNQNGSNIVRQADNMENYMKKYCLKHKIPLDISEKTFKEDGVLESITFENKVELAERVRRVNHETLAEIVKIVEGQCKMAIEEIDAERIQIKVDSLDKQTFDKLWGLVNYPDEAMTFKRIRAV